MKNAGWLWVATAVLLWPVNVLGIVNVDDIVIGTPDQGISGTLHVAVQGTSGNSDKFGVAADGQLQWQHGRHADFLLVSYAYGKSQGRVDTNRAFAHVRHRTQFHRRWAVEGFGQAEQDEFARLSFRGLVGAGVRLTLVEDVPSAAAYAGLGGFYEHEELKLLAGTTDPVTSSLWRANGYLTLKYRFNPQVRVLSTTFYQPAFADMADARLLEQAALYIKLNDRMDFKLTLEIRHDSKPPQRVEKTDISYATGIVIRF